MRIFIKMFIVLLAVTFSIEVVSAESLTIFKPKVEFVKIDKDAGHSALSVIDFISNRGPPFIVAAKNGDSYNQNPTFCKTSATLNVVSKKYLKKSGTEVIRVYGYNNNNPTVTDSVYALREVRIRGDDYGQKI